MESRIDELFKHAKSTPPKMRLLSRAQATSSSESDRQLGNGQTTHTVDKSSRRQRQNQVGVLKVARDSARSEIRQGWDRAIYARDKDWVQGKSAPVKWEIIPINRGISWSATNSEPATSPSTADGESSEENMLHVIENVLERCPMLFYRPYYPASGITLPVPDITTVKRLPKKAAVLKATMLDSEETVKKVEDVPSSPTVRSSKAETSPVTTPSTAGGLAGQRAIEFGSVKDDRRDKSEDIRPGFFGVPTLPHFREPVSSGQSAPGAGVTMSTKLRSSLPSELTTSITTSPEYRPSPTPSLGSKRKRAGSEEGRGDFLPQSVVPCPPTGIVGQNEDPLLSRTFQARRGENNPKNAKRQRPLTAEEKLVCHEALSDEENEFELPFEHRRLKPVETKSNTPQTKYLSHPDPNVGRLAFSFPPKSGKESDVGPSRAMQSSSRVAESHQATRLPPTQQTMPVNESMMPFSMDMSEASNAAARQAFAASGSPLAGPGQGFGMPGMMMPGHPQMMGFFNPYMAAFGMPPTQYPFAQQQFMMPPPGQGLPPFHPNISAEQQRRSAMDESHRQPHFSTQYNAITDIRGNEQYTDRHYYSR